MKNWKSLTDGLVLRGKLTPVGAKYVLDVTTAPPSRCPSNATGRNVLVDIASWKMGRTLQVESIGVEAAQAQEFERDPACVGYWPQPIKLPFMCADRNGVKRTLWLTFDFLVIYTDRVELCECKSESEALALSEIYPGRYSKDKEGNWVAPEIEAGLVDYGIEFKVRTTAGLNPILLRNYTLLEELRAESYSSSTALASIRSGISSGSAGSSLSELLSNAGACYTKNDVYLAILQSDLHVPLDHCLLVNAKTTRVFAKPHHADLHRSLMRETKPVSTKPLMLKPGTRVMWNSIEYSVCNTGPEKVYLRAPTGDPAPFSQNLLLSLLRDGEIVLLDEEVRGLADQHQELVRFCGTLSASATAAVRDKIQFLKILETDPGARPEDFGLKAGRRTIQRWRFRARQSELKYGTAFWGLLDEPRPGRPRDDLPQEMREDMSRFAESQYFTKQKRFLSYVWRALRDDRKARGLRYPSRGAFRRHVAKMKNAYAATRARDGEKAAYPLSTAGIHSPNWITAGDFPFKVGQMDGKLLDVELVDDETGELLGKPTLTLISLPHYGSVPIGWVLLFEPESYRSATGAVRRMMEQHGEPVKFLIVDNGRAFANATFDVLLATLDITKVNRRPRDPRFSSEIESLFRTIDREFVHNLEGNTKALRDPLKVTSETDPKKSAVWTFQEFHQRLEDYLNSLWDAPSLSLGTTPRHAIDRDRNHAPDRKGRFIIPPDWAKVAYFPEVDGGTRLVQPGRGVSVDRIYYWSDQMNRPSVEKSKVTVRYDPFDLSVVYCAIGGQWVECEAKRAPELRNVTERTRRVAAVACRTLRNNHAKRREGTHGVWLGGFGRKTRDDERVMRERRRARAQNAVRRDGGRTAPSEQPKGASLPKINFTHLKKTA